MSQHMANERRARYDALLMRRLTLAAAANALHAARNTCDASDGAVYRLREMTERCVDEAKVTEEELDRAAKSIETLDQFDQFDNLTVAEFGANWPELRAMVADNARLRAALLSSQWGSCDGCNNGHNYCPECKAPRKWWRNEPGIDLDEPQPGLHFHGCSIAAALESLTRLSS